MWSWGVYEYDDAERYLSELYIGEWYIMFCVSYFSIQLTLTFASVITKRYLEANVHVYNLLYINEIFL